MGRDLPRALYYSRGFQFQSTRPVWGVTALTSTGIQSQTFQSTRPVWGVTVLRVIHNGGLSISIHTPRVGRDSIAGGALVYVIISIHTPRVGRDRRSNGPLSIWTEFQSTRPVWGVTLGMLPNRIRRVISIHTPRVGRDGLNPLA